MSGKKKKRRPARKPAGQRNPRNSRQTAIPPELRGYRDALKLYTRTIQILGVDLENDDAPNCGGFVALQWLRDSDMTLCLSSAKEGDHDAMVGALAAFMERNTELMAKALACFLRSADSAARDEMLDGITQGVEGATILEDHTPPSASCPEFRKEAPQYLYDTWMHVIKVVKAMGDHEKGGMAKRSRAFKLAQTILLTTGCVAGINYQTGMTTKEMYTTVSLISDATRSFTQVDTKDDLDDLLEENTETLDNMLKTYASDAKKNSVYDAMLNSDPVGSA